MQGIIGIVVVILNLFHFIIPIILIVFCTIDIFKIIVTKKEDEVKKLRKDVIMKIVYTIIIYLIPYLVPIILNLVNNLIPFGYDNSWKECWDLVEKT